VLAVTAGCGSAAARLRVRPGMKSTDTAATAAPAAPTRNAIVKPESAGSPVARTCPAISAAGASSSPAAVFDAILEPLAAARDRALEAGDADGPLHTFDHEAVRLQRRQRGLIEALSHRPVASEVREQLRGPAVDIVTPLVERAHLDGQLGADFDAVDVLIALRMLAAVPDAPEIAARGGAGRYAESVLGGLRPR